MNRAQVTMTRRKKATFFSLASLMMALSVTPFGCASEESAEQAATATEHVNGMASVDDWTEMTQNIALWAGMVTFLLDTEESPARVYEADFINDTFDGIIASDFEGWTVKSPYGEKVWPNREAFLDPNTGYIPYNKKFANNTEHTITTPVILATGDDRALMYVNILNRTVDRLDSDKSVPMWKTDIHWKKDSGRWRITKGVAYYENH